ncbi:MAG: amidohydrolase [Clostridia bacterium]|nr:amidohydrolase [Clostridia bacterium]
MLDVKPDLEYIIRVRRELHRVPELRFDLPKTLAIVRRELESLGIEYTEKYGRSSIVAYLAKGRGRAIGIRADMDALPIKEESGVPFSSEHEGMMHACGHDAHTAMLIGTAKMLKECEDELPSEVRLFFQPSEEKSPGGAILMCEDGCMDGVEAILATHVDTSVEPGCIAFNYSNMNACSRGIKITAKGKVAHAATPHKGIDALAMAYKIYGAISLIKARELDPKECTVISIGMINGGTAPNNVCDKVEMYGTVRTHSDELSEHIFKRITEIAESVARDMGGEALVETTGLYPIVTNDKRLAEIFYRSSVRVLGEEHVNDKHEASLGGEDFSRYLKYSPGVFFRNGVKVQNVICSSHNANFVIDESALDVAPRMYLEFIKEYFSIK